MSNKNEKVSIYGSTEKRGETLTKPAKIAVRYLGGAALTIAVGVGLHHAASGPEMTGHQTVSVNPGDTVDGLIKARVEGGASHTGAVRTEVIDDPANADVFENGQLDPGEELELPEKAQ